VAYDEELAERVREELAGTADVAEIKMFGGLCFTVREHMAVGVNKDGLLVRVAPGDSDAALREPGAGLMEMGGRTMQGFLVVGPKGIGADADLRRWVDRGVTYASTLPPKTPKKPKTSKA
jgi:TfoX N-terminal domain